MGDREEVFWLTSYSSREVTEKLGRFTILIAFPPVKGEDPELNGLRRETSAGSVIDWELGSNP